MRSAATIKRIMLLIVIGILWLSLGVLLAVKFRDEHAVSQFELTRLSGKGDVVARELLTRQQYEPELESLRQVVITLVSTILVTSSVFALGIIRGILVGTVLLVIAPVLVRAGFISRLADRVRTISWPYALRVGQFARPVLLWLRQREIETNTRRVFSHDELFDVIHNSHGVLSGDEMRRLQAGLRFNSRRVADVMTPESMMVTANVHDTLGPLVMSELHESGHSRFPVIDDTKDHVVGMLYLKGLIDLKSDHQTVGAAMQKKTFFIREDQTLEHALHGFLRSHHHLFVVVNMYRETVGLLTLEDVIEALIGSKIVDEFDEFDDLRAVAEQNPRQNNYSPQHKDI